VTTGWIRCREVAVDGELDDLGVDEDEFELVGRKRVDQREDEIADTDGFAGAGGAGDEGVGARARSRMTFLPAISTPRMSGSSPALDRQASDSNEARRASGAELRLGISTPTKLSPGMGAWMRTALAESESARFFSRATMDSTRTPKPGLTRNWVTRGPTIGVVHEGVDGEAVEGVLEDALVGREFFGTGEVLLLGRSGAEEVERRELVAGKLGGRKRRGWRGGGCDGSRSDLRLRRRGIGREDRRCGRGWFRGRLQGGRGRLRVGRGGGLGARDALRVGLRVRRATRASWWWSSSGPDTAEEAG